MSDYTTRNVVERVRHLLEEQGHRAEGEIIEWLTRTGQWDPGAFQKVEEWLRAHEQADDHAARTAENTAPEQQRMQE